MRIWPDERKQQVLWVLSKTKAIVVWIFSGKIRNKWPFPQDEVPRANQSK